METLVDDTGNPLVGTWHLVRWDISYGDGRAPTLPFGATATGLILYHAIPSWTDGAELAFRRQAEFGIPLSFECLRDSSGRILKMGRMADLALADFLLRVRDVMGSSRPHLRRRLGSPPPHLLRDWRSIDSAAG